MRPWQLCFNVGTGYISETQHLRPKCLKKRVLGYVHTTSRAEQSRAERSSAVRCSHISGAGRPAKESVAMEDFVCAFLLLDSKKQKRKHWVHPINAKRDRYGDYRQISFSQHTAAMYH